MANRNSSQKPDYCQKVFDGDVGTNQLNMEDLEELFEAFTLFDKDYNGAISSKELGIVMQSISLNPTENELNDMINEAETTEENSIDFPEFLAFLSRKSILDKENRSELKQAFKVFCNEDDMIDSQSMKKVLTELGEIVNFKDIDELIRKADVDGDGKISFEGFTDMVKAKPYIKNKNKDDQNDRD